MEAELSDRRKIFCPAAAAVCVERVMAESMLKHLVMFVALEVSLGACGGDEAGKTPDAANFLDGKPVDAADTDVGFNKPTTTLAANQNNTAVGDADLTSCTADAPTTVAVTLATKVVDLQSQTPVTSASVTVFAGNDTTNISSTTTSDPTTGNVSITIPVARKRFGVQMTAASQFPTFLFNLYVDPMTATQTSPATIQSVSTSTAALLATSVDQVRTRGSGVIVGELRDCNKKEISNFVAMVSSTSGTATPIAGTQAFYFSLQPELPARHAQADSATANGLFEVLQLPATSNVYVQAWGFPTAADLASGEMKLISELAVPVLGDTVEVGSLEPTHN
jgi:hypothetical protein